jgi:hypothetical protein
MSSADGIGASSIVDVDATASSRIPAKPGLWQRVKGAVARTEKEFAFVKGLAIVSLVGTCIGAYFQYLSAYQDKVSAQAKDDMAAATNAFTETSNALSTAITLQDLLFYDFRRAAKLNAGGDANALTSKHAQELYKPYDEAASALRENINLIARKMEIYLDWASDASRDPATNTNIGTDPISTSVLGAFDFDCDRDMPSFRKENSVLRKQKNGRTLDIDWYSTKHHVLTIAYCFNVTQETWMEIVRQWASQSSLDQNDVAQFFSAKTADKLQARLDSEVVRLNAFMSRAMNEIEGIRVKYRPNGFYCNLPGIREGVGLFSNRCTPIHFSS